MSVLQLLPQVSVRKILKKVRRVFKSPPPLAQDFPITIINDMPIILCESKYAPTNDTCLIRMTREAYTACKGETVQIGGYNPVAGALWGDIKLYKQHGISRDQMVFIHPSIIEEGMRVYSYKKLSFKRNNK
jgi:hypothetical protein